MGKISNKVSKGLGAAIAEAQAKMTGTVVTNINDSEGIENISNNEVETLLNSGAEAQKKRKTKKSSKDNIKLKKDKLSEEELRPKTHEEFCEHELKKAHDKNLPEPDFDFRNHYEKGDVIFYVRIFEALGEKEVKKLTIRTIYPRLMIGCEAKGCCYVVGYNERDKIFSNPYDADTYCDSIKVTAKYLFNKPEADDENITEEEDSNDNED